MPTAQEALNQYRNAVFFGSHSNSNTVADSQDKNISQQTVNKVDGIDTSAAINSNDSINRSVVRVLFDEPTQSDVIKNGKIFDEKVFLNDVRDVYNKLSSNVDPDTKMSPKHQFLLKICSMLKLPTDVVAQCGSSTRADLNAFTDIYNAEVVDDNTYKERQELGIDHPMFSGFTGTQKNSDSASTENVTSNSETTRLDIRPKNYKVAANAFFGDHVNLDGANALSFNGETEKNSVIVDDKQNDSDAAAIGAKFASKFKPMRMQRISLDNLSKDFLTKNSNNNNVSNGESAAENASDNSNVSSEAVADLSNAFIKFSDAVDGAELATSDSILDGPKDIAFK